MSTIYESVLPLTVHYNGRVAPFNPLLSPKTDSFIENLNQTAGNGTFHLKKTIYPENKNKTNWKHFYTNIANRLPKGTIGSYSIE